MLLVDKAVQILNEELSPLITLKIIIDSSMPSNLSWNPQVLIWPNSKPVLMYVNETNGKYDLVVFDFQKKKYELLVQNSKFTAFTWISNITLPNPAPGFRQDTDEILLAFEDSHQELIFLKCKGN